MASLSCHGCRRSLAHTYRKPACSAAWACHQPIGAELFVGPETTPAAACRLWGRRRTHARANRHRPTIAPNRRPGRIRREDAGHPGLHYRVALRTPSRKCILTHRQRHRVSPGEMTPPEHAQRAGPMSAVSHHGGRSLDDPGRELVTVGRQRAEADPVVRDDCRHQHRPAVGGNGPRRGHRPGRRCGIPRIDGGSRRQQLAMTGVPRVFGFRTAEAARRWT